MSNSSRIVPVVKAWGVSTTICAVSSFEVQRINVMAGGYCSRHKHLKRHNLFYVEYGKLVLHIFESNTDNCVKVLIDTGEQYLVGPGVEHMFENPEVTSVIAYEIYWDENINGLVLSEDIVRFSIGGIGRQV